MTHPEPEPDDLTPLTFEQEETADLRRDFWQYAVRLAVVFGLLIGGVYFASWWSGSAIRFGAARATNRSVPTWEVSGTVQDFRTHTGIPWARVEDDPTGQPPLFHADADQLGKYELHTLAEPHRLLVSASGYRSSSVSIGRRWFLWLPEGKEHLNIELMPY